LLAYPKPGTGFPTSNAVVFFVFSELELAVIVHFAGIGGIINNHCLKCLFINNSNQRQM
jgi:hypothetical protein